MSAMLSLVFKHKRKKSENLLLILRLLIDSRLRVSCHSITRNESVKVNDYLHCALFDNPIRSDSRSLLRCAVRVIYDRFQMNYKKFRLNIVNYDFMEIAGHAFDAFVQISTKFRKYRIFLDNFPQFFRLDLRIQFEQCSCQIYVEETATWERTTNVATLSQSHSHRATPSSDFVSKKHSSNEIAYFPANKI